MINTRLAAGLLAAACVCFAARAKADPVELFEKGRDLARDGHCIEAIPLFTASLEQAPAVGPLLNLGHCYELLGKTASAADAFARAAQVAAQRGDARKDEAAERERALEPVLSTLRVAVPQRATQSVLEVRVDGTLLARPLWDVERRIDPGSHTIDVAYVGRGHRSAVIAVGPKSDHVSYTVLPNPFDPTTPIGPPPPVEAPPSHAETTSPPQEGASQRSIGLLSGGIGIAGLVLGAVFGAVSLSARADVREMCPTYPHCVGGTNRDSLTDRNDTAVSAGTAATIAFVAGGALLATGAVVFFTAPRAQR